MSQGEKREVLERRDSEIFCATFTLLSTSESIFNVTLQYNIQSSYTTFCERDNQQCCFVLISPQQADLSQSHKAKPHSCPAPQKAQQASSQPPPTICK